MPKKINVLNVWKEHVDVLFGEENKTGGEYAIKSLKAAVAALKDSKIDALVTAPINKSNIQSESFNFPGHTDYLAQELEGESSNAFGFRRITGWTFDGPRCCKRCGEKHYPRTNRQKNEHHLPYID